MSVNINDLSDQEKYTLLEISYIDFDLEMLEGNCSLTEMLEDALKNPYINEEKEMKIRELQQELATMSKLHDIRIVGYENHNQTGMIAGDSQSGFVGYALEDGNGNRGFLFRGSETESFVDWTDNVLSAATGTSSQVEQAKAFFNKHKVDGVTHSLYGHSKGNNLSTEVFVDHLDMDIYAYGVNGQPIYWFDLNDQQKAALRGDRYTFIVHEGDFVSALGHVDYIDKMVQVKDSKLGFFYPHSLSSVEFDAQGGFVSSRPANISDYFLQGLFEVSPFIGLGTVIGATLAKRYYYWIVNGMKQMIAGLARGTIEIVNDIKYKCEAVLAKLGNLAKQSVQQWQSWFNSVLIAAKGFVGQVMGWFAGNLNSRLYAPEIKVHTTYLRELAARLQRVQNRIQGVDRKLDNLTRLVRLEDKLAVMWIDTKVGYDYDIKRAADYLNIAAESFDQCERTLRNRASEVLI